MLSITIMKNNVTEITIKVDEDLIVDAFSSFLSELVLLQFATVATYSRKVLVSVALLYSLMNKTGWMAE